ncbi:flagellar filament capping protein FliD [Gemmatimonas groenlandica]|uniref:Flagellar hook-associated protein 2 n=1 Tax=Gemmatimonas groenlandica TaxID=2732249 RepID=A0A6M4INX9_9BACT|nr:flagellar filament capping protein FliD [Gemmatimonas groenlandica]QJR36433.1 flagellar filament capping protein FliD [Gemmatimonas groenlandica]
MSSPINISGLSTGIQWGDIVDSTIKAYEARQVTPITDRITKRAAQKTAWTKMQGLVETLNTNARNLRRTGFGGFLATVPPSPSTSRTLLSATASLTATPGRYRVEVLQLADTAKIGGASVADTTAARGLTGSMSINGTSIDIVGTESLADIRTKINDANIGVTAAIVSEGGTAGRLVLTSNTAGASGVTIADGTGGMARELGFIDTRSKPISSASMSAAAALGLAVSPQPASIRVGSTLITADLATESIASIAAKINAAGGAASVESEAYGSETRYRLVVDGNVTAVDGDADSQAVIDALGFAAGTTGSVKQTVQTPVYTDAADAVAGAATSLVGLKFGGSASNLAVGDAINIRGMRGDGTAVTIGLVVGASDTMQTLLDKVNDATTGFGSGSRTATAALGSDGRMRLTDETGGASRLSMSMSVTHADGTTGSLGSASTSVAGRSRELQVGQDAVIRVDGREVTRSTNNITDAIAGVTLSLSTAEPGTEIDVTIDRDVKGTVDSVQKFVDSYNEIRKFFDEQRLGDAPLYADTLLRGVVSTFQEALRTDVSSNPTYNKLTIAGVTLDRNGILTFNQDTFKTALADKPSEIEALFGFSGVGQAFVTATDNATQFGVGTISAQLKNINQNTILLKKREADAQKRIELKREQLVAQFTRMEEAMSRLTSQSSSLLSSVKGLQGNG